MHSVIQAVTESIRQRSQSTRQQYVDLMNQYRGDMPSRFNMGCTNLAHVQASAQADEQLILREGRSNFNFGIISAYNDMLSAHQPYYRYPERIKEYLYPYGVTAQVAGGVPAMCDGVTQGYEGMELSLFSRDTIALSTAIAMSHQAFDGMLLLGICDKIVPGLLMGALRFGHLPAVFLPSGPMPSGISNQDKAKVRQAFAKGEASESALLDSEAKAYHSSGTCTFYGTANSNQMLLEAMGLVLPGSAFVQPHTELRNEYDRWGCLAMVSAKRSQLTLGDLVNEKSLVNALVVLLATGGSTNLAIHWLAVARCAGYLVTWEDLHELSNVIPLICRVYPNGPSDINQFHQAGGTAWVFSQLTQAGLMHGDTLSILGQPFAEDYVFRQQVIDGKWQSQPPTNDDDTILASVESPFMESGGIVEVKGNVGKALIKVSAVPRSHWNILAQAKVFDDQQQVKKAYENGQLNEDCVVVVKGQGPKANGMPELHKLIPILSNLQDEGYRVALLTDGRLSGASGKVLSAIHCVPEAANEGAIAKIQEGDWIEIDAENGFLTLKNVELDSREAVISHHANYGVGRELFGVFRKQVTPADEGAMSVSWEN